MHALRDVSVDIEEARLTAVMGPSGSGKSTLMRRMVRHQSTITALIGAGLGLPVGLFLAGIVTRRSDQGLAFAVPVASLAVFVAAGFVAGLVAAVAPVRRAARLDVLRALQYE